VYRRQATQRVAKTMRSLHGLGEIGERDGLQRSLSVFIGIGIYTLKMALQLRCACDFITLHAQTHSQLRLRCVCDAATAFLRCGREINTVHFFCNMHAKAAMNVQSQPITSCGYFCMQRFIFRAGFTCNSRKLLVSGKVI
jgi:hypothetical protein